MGSQPLYTPCWHPRKTASCAWLFTGPFQTRYAMTPPNPIGDALLIDADVVSKQYADALTLSLFFRFFDPSEKWLDDGSLPPPLPDLDALSERTLELFYQDVTGAVHRRTGEIENLTQVPEPATGALVLAGLASAAWTRRRMIKRGPGAH